jgi:hypothetical protein
MTLAILRAGRAILCSLKLLGIKCRFFCPSQILLVPWMVFHVPQTILSILAGPVHLAIDSFRKHNPMDTDR